MEVPWLCVGDFNDITKAEEIKGGANKKGEANEGIQRSLGLLWI